MNHLSRTNRHRRQSSRRKSKKVRDTGAFGFKNPISFARARALAFRLTSPAATRLTTSIGNRRILRPLAPPSGALGVVMRISCAKVTTHRATYNVARAMRTSAAPGTTLRASSMASTRAPRAPAAASAATARARRALESRRQEVAKCRHKLQPPRFTACRAEGYAEASPKWCANDLEWFIARVSEEKPDAERAGRALERARVGVVDWNAVAACAWTGAVRAREMQPAEVRRCTKISERWKWRVGGGLAAVEASLGAEDVRDAPSARAVAALVTAARRDVERVVRCYLHDAILEEEKFAMDDKTSEMLAGVDEMGKIPVRWRLACANINLYLDATGVALTHEEWQWIREIFDGLVSMIEEDDASVSIVRDDATWRDMRELIDDSSARPRKSSQKANSERYLLAQGELLDARKQWSEAQRTYKNARQRVKLARHNVHKSRKAVRIEFR